MKKIVNLLPVALALLALASCSNDDLTAQNAGEIQLKPNEILVKAEALGDGESSTMRAGFVEDEITVGSRTGLSFATLFNNGDVMKIYDDSKDWRPQDWTCTSTNDVQYAIETGAAGGDEAVFTAPEGTTKYTSGYGIYPSKYGTPAKRFGEFTDEDRTSMKYDFDMFKVYKAEIGAANLPETSAYKDGLFCKFPVPMWGVANNTETMTLKYLTAFLRIDISNLPAITNTETNPNSRWILIRSDKALTGEFTAKIADPDAELPTAAPVLVGPTAVVATDALNAYPKTGSATTGANSDILVNIGDAAGNITVFVPIAAGQDAAHKITHNFNIYLSDATSDLAATTTIDFSGANAPVKHQNNAAIAKSVYRGQVYNVIDDSRNVNAEANTPFEVAKAIVAADKLAKRDFTLTFQNDIIVKNDDVSPQNYDIDFTGGNTEYLIDGVGADGYVLKHKVTINAKFVKNGTAATNLTIKTKAGSKDLTINFANGTDIANVTVPAEGANGLNSNLILTSDAAADKIPNITNESVKKLTVKSSCALIKSFGEFTIDAPVTNFINKVVLGKAAKKLNILKGYPIAIELGAGDEAITDNVTIYSEGASTIGSFSYVNMPTTTSGTKKTDKFNVSFESKWDGLPYTYAAGNIINHAGTTISNVIMTAAQLAKYDGTADAYLIGTYDLDSKNVTSKALTNKFTGAQYYKYNASAAPAFVGNATIKKLAGKNGLFASFTPSAANDFIKNLTFDECTVKQTAATTTGTALLVGSVDGSNAAVIENIVVNANNKITADLKSENVAAVAGKVTGTLTLSGIDVKAASVEGYAYVGGIIGGIDATAANAVVNFKQSKDGATVTGTTFNAADVYNTSAAVVKCHKVAGTSNSQNYATCGTFLGSFVEGTTNTATINIYAKVIPQKVNLTAGLDATALWQWSALVGVDHVKYRIHNYFKEFGLCGVTGKTTTNELVGAGAGTIGSGITYNIPNSSAAGTPYTTTRTYKGSFGTTAPVDNKPSGSYYMNWIDTNPIEE